MSRNDVAPPYTNRGVQNTYEKSLIACVDWLQVTFLGVANPYSIVQVLGLNEDDFTPFETGKYGYTYHIRFGHISVYYSDAEVRSECHLEITGQGCREYESYAKHDWSTLLELFFMLKINITRLDLALDDYKGYFQLSTIIKKIERGEVRSRFKYSDELNRRKLKDGTNAGRTVYFGSRKSDIQIRMYDKKKERENEGLEVLSDHWIRTEIQLRDDRALLAALNLINRDHETGHYIKGILKNYLTFVNPTNDSNKSRWPVSPFWERFLGDVDKIKLTKVAPDRTIERTKEWFTRSVSPAFYMLYEAFDYDSNLIQEFLNIGKDRLSKKHKEMINTFKAQNDILLDMEFKKKSEIKQKLLSPRKLKNDPNKERSDRQSN